MIFFLAKLLRSVPGLNARALTEADFYRICRREKIKVVEMPLLVPGFYMTCARKRFIVIDSRLRGVEWLHVAFHELTHHFLHAPHSASAPASLFFQVREEGKILFEAEAGAAIALIPEWLIRSKLPGEIEEEYGYPRKMIKFRRQIAEMYGV